MNRSTSLMALIFSIALLTSCSRSKSDAGKKDSSGSLQGEWELRNVKGGFRPANSPSDFPPGNGRIWKFEDSIYTIYDKGQVTGSGVFTLDRGICPETQTEMDAFVMTDPDGFQVFYEFSRDTLILYIGMIAADGTVEKYVRVEER